MCHRIVYEGFLTLVQLSNGSSTLQPIIIPSTDLQPIINLSTDFPHATGTLEGLALVITVKSATVDVEAEAAVESLEALAVTSRLADMAPPATSPITEATMEAAITSPAAAAEVVRTGGATRRRPATRRDVGA